ncbi:MAG: TonB-dependent receptor [Cryomorphaceae bacterium]|nr:TonB-dependent receptor [Cryomorphaceae bacterium]
MRFNFAFIAIFIVNTLFAQSNDNANNDSILLVKGYVKSHQGEPVQSASIEVFHQQQRLIATITNTDGEFSFSLGRRFNMFTVQIRHIGYYQQSKSLNLDSNLTTLSFTLQPLDTELPGIVVSAGRTEQRLEETTVSVMAVPASLVKNKNPTDIQQTMDQVPGVNVTEGQVNIRSGSGWSYGAGTRVLTLIDDLPLISPDANQILWPLVPFESLEQMEVLKGASSALYGSSALNGVINVRTRSPFEKKTYANVFLGMYDAPAQNEWQWWDQPLLFSGLQVSHSNHYNLGKGKLGYLVGVNGLQDPGFRWNAVDNRMRTHWKTAYKQKLSANRFLEMGINGTVSHRKSGEALIWESGSNPYMAQDSSVTVTNGVTYFIDPYLEISYGNESIQHSDKLQLRFLSIDNVASDKVNRFDNASRSQLIQYQHQAKFDRSTITAGVFGLFSDTESEIFGNHIAANQAIFLQGDFPWKRWNFSAGARYEYFQVNEINQEQPVFRAGANYALTKSTNIFSNYGEGFRFPSIAELYTETNVGAINIFPAQNLRPEFGQTMEFGVKQLIGNDVFKSRMEVAAYYMRFTDMIEFMFSNWGNSGVFFNDLGFSSVNVGDVSISGIEWSYAGSLDLPKQQWQFLVGYTYANPIVRNPEEQLVDGRNITYKSTSSDTSNVLKYRYKHLVRADIQCKLFDVLRIGGSVRYNDFMQAIDQAFNTLIPDVRSTRERLNTGDLFIDVRVGYQLNKNVSMNLICDNLLNREVMIRPAMMGMPRRFMVQMILDY